MTSIATAIAEIFRTEHRRVLATVVRLVGDFDLAEDAVQESFLVATRQWPKEGLPANPVAWLVSSARFKAIDAIRRRTRQRDLEPEIARLAEELALVSNELSEREINDDQLRLILACCHPALDFQVQIALTLREVCGLTTEAIAAAFLVAPATMAQRIVRGKSKIRDAGIPFHIPGPDELPQRIEAVLMVCYLVFNEGYSASSGDHHTRPDLAGEAIRLGRLLCALLPDAETFGLLALMLLHDSRRAARTTSAGDLVLLEEQDRSRWDQVRIREAHAWLAQAMAAEPIGTYAIQAAIAAVHADAATAQATDWARIAGWYDALVQASPSPVVELNRAVAIAMRDGPEAGLALVEALQATLIDYHLYHATRGDLLRRSGRASEACAAFRQALDLAQQEPERRFLIRRLAELGDAAGAQATIAQ
ncbi:MAG: RNA polymerase sigma factor [Planctomycetes bacterium]|nr:RNA polymerase sigma factor [Planctomycetota bacterium]